MNLHRLDSPRGPARSGQSRSPRGPLAGRAWIGWIALASGVLLGMMLFAPARWLASALAAHTPLLLTDARGTVWKGSAQLWLSGGAGSTARAALPQRLRWQLALTMTGPVVQIQADCCTPHGLRLSLGLQDARPVLRLQDAQSVWPAGLLTGLGTPWNTLQPSGQLVLRTQDLALRISGQGLQAMGQATLDLQNLSSALSTLQPMGSYRLHIHTGSQLQLQLHTLHGDLLLSGQGQWAPSGLQFRGEARAAAGREDALGNILRIIGKRDGARTLISLG